MQEFVGSIDVRLTDATEHRRVVWRLLSPVTYGAITLLPGSTTDGVSRPWWLGWVVPAINHQTFGPALIHDCLLVQRAIERAAGARHERSRVECDRLFLEGLRSMQVPPWKSGAYYAAVRLQAFYTRDV